VEKKNGRGEKGEFPAIVFQKKKTIEESTATSPYHLHKEKKKKIMLSCWNETFIKPDVVTLVLQQKEGEKDREHSI